MSQVSLDAFSRPRTPPPNQRAKVRRWTHAAAACAAALLAGCCTGPSYMALAYNPRIELEQRRIFAVVAPVLSDSTVWAYGAPAERIAAREDAYRADPTRGAQLAVGAPDDAPAALAAALEQLTSRLTELGYRAARADEQEEFVVALALSWHDDGRLARATPCP